MMNKTEIQQLLNLLYRLEDLHEYDETEIGNLIGLHVDKLQDKLK